MNKEFIKAINQIEQDKKIDKEILFKAIEDALVSAYKKNFGANHEARVELDRKNGDIHVYSRYEIVEKVADKDTQKSLSQAREKDPAYNVGDIYEDEVTPKDFGRVAAQSAKQVVVQRIREAERESIYDNYISKEHDLVTGKIQRVDKSNVIVELDRTEAIMPKQEQNASEEYESNMTLKFYVAEVKQTTKGPQVILSRQSPELVKRLFESECPEIHDGVVEIKNISREAGSRTKMSVFSNDPNVDPIGACIGPRRSRINVVLEQLKGEKIDIVKWNDDIATYIGESLSPAAVSKVIVNEEEKSAKVFVPANQLSLAIGREGQNVRLAAKMTGWKIDISSEEEVDAV